MTTIEHLSRREAIAERERLLASFRTRFGTDDRAELRDLSFADALSDEDIDAVERIRSLDFLLAG